MKSFVLKILFCP